MLLSSHLLAEVEAVADRMMIIGGGRIRAQGTRDELLTGSGTIVEADDLAALDAALHRAGLATHPADGDRRLVEAEPDVVARAAMTAGVVLRRLAPADGAGLERLFFELTTNKSRPIRSSRAGRSPRMSTTALTAPIPVDAARVHARPGLGRLVAVELRKMVDTRAGFWLQVATVALTVVAVTVSAFVGDAADHTFAGLLDAGGEARRRPAADRRHPARHLGVVPAHRDDHLRAGPGALTRPRRQARSRA